MAYQPLTEDQFNKAKSSGFSTDQIISFEKQRKGQDFSRTDPSFQGGATSPANVAAQKDLKQAQGNVEGLDPLVGAGQAAYNMSWPMSLLAKNAIGQGKSPIAEPTTSGGKLLGDIGMVANPMADAAVIAGLKGIGIGSKVISDIAKFSKPQNRIGLAEEARMAVSKSKNDLMNTFGGEAERIIGQSDKKINIEEPISNFMEESKGLLENKEFIQDLKLGNPNAKRILDLVEKFGKEDFQKELSAQGANDVSKYIKNLPSIKTKLSKPAMFRDLTNDERILVNLSNDIKESVIKEHPDLQNLNEHYAETINDIKSIRGNLRPNKTIDNLKKYSSWDDELKKSFERQVPKETIDKIKGFENSDKTAQMLKKLGIEVGKGAAVMAGGGAAYEVGKNIMGR